MASYAAIHPSSNQDGILRGTSHGPSGRRRHQKQGGYAGSASWASSVINILNTIVGAGVLAMPHALSNMGIVLGVLVILWSGLMSGFGLYLQTQCARYLDRGTASFFALSQITYPNAAVIFDAAIAIKCFGVAVSYLIIIGDLMPGVVRGFGEPQASFLVDRQFWITAFMLVVIPLSFLRRLDSLKYTSVIALGSIAYLVVLVVWHFASRDTVAERGAVHWVQWQGLVPTLASFPVIVFAYTCHQNMFSVLNEIADNSPARTNAVIMASIGGAASIYVLVAITGYLSFGDNIMGNIIAQYSPSIASTIGRAAIVVLVMFSYPLQIHPCRASVDAVSKWRPAGLNKQPELTPASGSPNRTGLLSPPKKVTSRPKNDEMTEWRFAIISTVVIILSYTTAMLVSSLDKVLAYVGSTGSTSISFILPGVFYYKISSPDSAHSQRLLKDDEDDDYDDEDDDDDDTRFGSRPVSREGSLSARLHNRQWRRALLRKLSLALAIYGGVVMITCLVTNTFLIAAK